MITRILKQYRGIIRDYDVKRFHQTESSYRLVVEFELIDNSTLIVRDYLFVDGKRKYAYHYQDENRHLIFRYDNAPHWPNISTFPYHKHTPSGLESSEIMTLGKVFAQVNNHLDE